MTRLETIRTYDDAAAQDAEIDEWMTALAPADESWGLKTGPITENTLRVMARSDTEYSVIDLWKVFADPERRETFVEEELSADEQAVIRPYLSIEDDAIFAGLARQVGRYVERSARDPRHN